MKLLVFAAALAAVSTAAFADAPKTASCIDPHKSYVARPLNNHEIFVQTSLGTPKPPVRLTTSCIHLESAIGFGLSAQINCVGLGDTVVATINGSGPQFCIVTRVKAYEPQDGDIKQP